MWSVMPSQMPSSESRRVASGTDLTRARSMLLLHCLLWKVGFRDARRFQLHLCVHLVSSGPLGLFLVHHLVCLAFRSPMKIAFPLPFFRISLRVLLILLSWVAGLTYIPVITIPRILTVMYYMYASACFTITCICTPGFVSTAIPPLPSPVGHLGGLLLTRRSMG